MGRDVFSAWRLFRREPGFAAIVVLSLAIGIGANTAIFSVVDGILLRDLPYRDPGRLVVIHENVPQLSHLYPRLPANLNHFYEWRKQCKSFERIAAMQAVPLNLTGWGEPELLNAARVSANTFDVLGVRPRLGRTFLEEEEPSGRDQVVVLADSLWKRRFHSDRAIVGRKVMIDGSPYVVVGVLPASFRLPGSGDEWARTLGEKTEIFKPLGYTDSDRTDGTGRFNYTILGRLKAGVRAEAALAELNVVQKGISAHLEEKLDLRAVVTRLQENQGRPVRRGLLVVMAAVGAVLLVLCVNLANLSLARAAGRARDTAIRTALGASRGQLIRQGLGESVLLSLFGGGLGIAVAYWGVRLLVMAAPANLPRLYEVGVDGRVLGFALLISVATGVVFGILPALHSARTQPQEALKSGSHTSTENIRGVHVRSALVSLEAGLSTVLLVAAGLLTGSLVRLMNVNRGFDVERVMTVNVAVPASKYGEPAQRSSFFDRALSKAQALPGVQSAAVVNALPLEGETWIDIVYTESDHRPMFERPKVNVRFIGPEYFKTLHIPLRGGRAFRESDRPRRVAIISHAVAEELWPGQNPVGRKMVHNDRPVEVVGETPDIRSTSLDKQPVLMLYEPYWQCPGTTAWSFVARTAMDPRVIAGQLRNAVWEVDSDVPVTELKTMEQVMAQSVSSRRFTMTLVGIFAAAALALAGLGTYGVVAYSVTRRRPELGIRLALGASPTGIRRMVLRQGMKPVVVGLALGIAGALAAGRVMQSLLFEVNPRDPATMAAVAVVLLGVATAACAIPARKATRVDPVAVLKADSL